MVRDARDIRNYISYFERNRDQATSRMVCDSVFIVMKLAVNLSVFSHSEWFYEFNFLLCIASAKKHRPPSVFFHSPIKILSAFMRNYPTNSPSPIKKIKSRHVLSSAAPIVSPFTYYPPKSEMPSTMHLISSSICL